MYISEINGYSGWLKIFSSSGFATLFQASE